MSALGRASVLAMALEMEATLWSASDTYVFAIKRVAAPLATLLA